MIEFLMVLLEVFSYLLSVLGVASASIMLLAVAVVHNHAALGRSRYRWLSVLAGVDRIAWEGVKEDAYYYALHLMVASFVALLLRVALGGM